MTTAELITDLAHYETEAKRYESITEANLEAALVFIETLKNAAKNLDAKRLTDNKPHQQEIDATNARCMPTIKFCDGAWRKMAGRVAAYREEVERQILLAQQAEIEKANREREEAEQLAQIARDTAAVEALQGNETAADSLTTQAQTLELEAALTIPKVVQQQPKSYVLPSGGSMSFRNVLDWLLPGKDKAKKIYADDPMMKDLDRRFFILDPVKVNDVLKAEGKLPLPFRVTTKPINTSRSGR